MNDMVVEFMRNAAESGSRTHLVTSGVNLNDVLQETLTGEITVFCPAVTELERSINISEHLRTTDYQNASMVIEEVLAGVSESGTIMVRDYHDKPIQASMLCEHYVAILHHCRLVATFEDLFASFDQLPANLSLITGPSRTADIEKTLVMGMHGAAKVSIVIV